MKYLKVFVIFCKVWLAKLFLPSIKVSFKKIDRSWYCDIAGWPEEYFLNSLMVLQASQLIETMAEGDDYVTFDVAISNRPKRNMGDYALLTKHYSALKEGAFFSLSNSGFVNECYFNNVWLCPVTLFVLGRYPQYIYFKRVK